MKKCIFLIFMIFFTSFNKLIFCTRDTISLSKFTLDEIEFINNNNIGHDELIPYLNFSTFNVYNFFEYEKIRKEKNLSYLQALNLINYPNYYNKYILPKKAIFQNSFLLLVNKEFYLDNYFIPEDLISLSDTKLSYIKRDNEIMKANKEVLNFYKELEDESKKNGFNLVIFSAYRSYSKQYHLYYEVNNSNDKTVARPGFSEHQTGYSLDISTLQYGLTTQFEESNEFKWLENNCYKYGFILRYPKDKEDITGYSYEPWHFRYVGKDTATFIFNNNLTLEEYLFNNFELK